MQPPFPCCPPKKFRLDQMMLLLPFYLKDAAQGQDRMPRDVCWLAILCILAQLACQSYAWAQPIASDSPISIYHHGQILTVDSKFTVNEAFAVRGQRITAVGSNETILKLAEVGAEIVDLKGSTVLPGLIDSHVHAANASVSEWDHPVPAMHTVSDVLDYVRSRTAVIPKGKWIVINQVFITRLDDQRFPTRGELDSVAPNHPVCFATGPDASLNTAALQEAGIDRDYHIPEAVGVSNAKVERDPPTGDPTGILRNYSKLIRVKDTSRTPSLEERQTALKQLLADYNSVGITSIAERSVSAESLKLFESLLELDQLSCRVFLNWFIDPATAWPDIEKQVRQAINHPRHAYDDRLWLRGVKVFLDGGMLTGSAFMRDPWGVSRIYSIDDPQYRGIKYIDPEKLYQLAKLCLENDLQFTAHSVGDGAVHALIAAYEQINNDFPVRPTRPCITHCNFMSREAIDKMASLGIVADLQPAWLWLDGATLEKQFGQPRLKYFQPYRSIFESGVVVGGGSDHMQKIGSLRSINPYNPFLGMSIALKRIPRGRQAPLHPQECISREQALRLYTINNAFLLLDEANRGSIEVGKLADFCIIDRDFLTCSPDELAETQVTATYLGGRLVYLFN